MFLRKRVEDEKPYSFSYFYIQVQRKWGFCNICTNISTFEYIFLTIMICHHKPLLQENHISLVSKSSQYCQFWNGKGPITQLSPLEYYNWWDMNRLPKDTVKSLIWHPWNGTADKIGHPRGTCQNLPIRSKYSDFLWWIIWILNGQDVYRLVYWDWLIFGV